MGPVLGGTAAGSTPARAGPAAVPPGHGTPALNPGDPRAANPFLTHH